MRQLSLWGTGRCLWCTDFPNPSIVYRIQFYMLSIGKIAQGSSCVQPTPPSSYTSTPNQRNSILIRPVPFRRAVWQLCVVVIQNVYQGLTKPQIIGQTLCFWLHMTVVCCSCVIQRQENLPRSFKTESGCFYFLQEPNANIFVIFYIALI